MICNHEWKERDDSPSACIERVCIKCDKYDVEDRDSAAWRLFGTGYADLNKDEKYLLDNGFPKHCADPDAEVNVSSGDDFDWDLEAAI